MRKLQYDIFTVRTRFRIPTQGVNGFRPKKPKTMNLYWVKTLGSSYPNIKSGRFDDKRMKIHKCMLEKKTSSAFAEDIGFFIMLLGKVTSLIFNCYSVSFLLFSPPLSHSLLLLLYCLSLSSPPSTCIIDGWFGYLSH